MCLVSCVLCFCGARTDSKLVVGEGVDLDPFCLHALVDDMQAVGHHGQHDNGSSRLEAVQGLLRKVVGGRHWHPWLLHFDASDR